VLIRSCLLTMDSCKKRSCWTNYHHRTVRPGFRFPARQKSLFSPHTLDGTAARLDPCQIGSGVVSLVPKRLQCKALYHNEVPRLGMCGGKPPLKLGTRETVPLTFRLTTIHVTNLGICSMVLTVLCGGRSNFMTETVSCHEILCVNSGKCTGLTWVFV
jgi:hypothetical protein